MLRQQRRLRTRELCLRDCLLAYLRLQQFIEDPFQSRASRCHRLRRRLERERLIKSDCRLFFWRRSVSWIQSSWNPLRPPRHSPNVTRSLQSISSFFRSWPRDNLPALLSLISHTALRPAPPVSVGGHCCCCYHATQELRRQSARCRRSASGGAENRNKKETGMTRYARPSVPSLLLFRG